MISPTPRQAELLRFIAGYQAAHDGASPSYSEMSDAIGIVPSGIFQLLAGLQERGIIHRLANRRKITIAQRVPIPRAPDGAPLYAVSISA